MSDNREPIDKIDPQLANEIGKVIWRVQGETYANIAERVEGFRSACNAIAHEFLMHAARDSWKQP